MANEAKSNVIGTDLLYMVIGRLRRQHDLAILQGLFSSVSCSFGQYEGH